jgi:heme exporter protein A
LNLDVGQGERLALLGPNGAGKSTVLRLASTLARPTHGKLAVLGHDPVRKPREVRRRIGVVAHRPYLYDDLTGRENLAFYARLYAVPDAEQSYGPLLINAGLEHASDAFVRTYSRGMQQRLALVRALLHEPEVLLLDEPETGLDQDALDLLERIVCDGGAERTVIFSTHNLQLALRLSSRVVVLSAGGLVLDAPTALLDETRLRAEYSRLAGVSR